MNKTTLTALNGSIEHWKRLATGKRQPHEDLGADHCALCVLYMNNGCQGCPVARATGERYCRGTPYPRADALGDEFTLDSRQFKAAAKKELAFLKSLLPKKRKP